MQNAVAAAVQDPQYSKQAFLCATGSDQASMQECEKAYWNFSSNPATPPQACNYFYLRVANEYWSGLTPMVLNQLGDYLGVKADGQNQANLNAGPHNTLATYDGNPVYLPTEGAQSATLTVTGGKLDGSNVESQVAALIKAGKGDSGSKYSTPVLPLLGADQMTPNCTDGVYSNPNSRWPWTKSNIADVTATKGTIFWCTINTTSQGTAYAQVTLGAPQAGSIPAQVSINVPTDQESALRKDPNGPYTLDNIIWPVQLPEVQARTPIDFTTPTGNACFDRSNKPASCVHLWVNQPRKQGDTYTACKLYVVLEVQSPAANGILTKYGAQPLTQPHISLAVSPKPLSGSDAATYCKRAADLNTAIGQNPLGNPPPTLGLDG